MLTRVPKTHRPMKRWQVQRGPLFDAPPPDPPGLDAATSAAEGPPEPPRGGMAPPPPEGAAGCQGAERPAVAMSPSH